MKGCELTLEERKALQLEMLKEIDSFCRINNIKYALSCGTLIGAVRHHGFIPWDDDVDITMSYLDILRFRDLFQSDNLKYCDIDTEPYYEYHFSRIVSKKTYSKIGIGIKKLNGLCIDLYPIIECSSDTRILNDLILKGVSLLKKRLWYLKWNSRIQRFTPFPVLPGSKTAIKNYYDFMIHEVQSIGGKSFYQMGGPLIGDSNNFYHNLWSFNPLEELIEENFEDSKFFIPAKFDAFLTKRYGNYMELPPERDRHPYHGTHYYWK